MKSKKLKTLGIYLMIINVICFLIIVFKHEVNIINDHAFTVWIYFLILSLAGSIFLLFQPWNKKS
jgi:hypothetical protein